MASIPPTVAAYEEVHVSTAPDVSPIRPRASHSSEAARHERWIVAIGVLKLFKAALFILLGIGAVKLLHKDLVDVVEHFILSMRFDPEGHFVNLVIEKVALIDPHRLRLISYAIFAYAGVDIIEGVGLVMRKLWAEFVTLILTASFLPWEFYELARHTTSIKVLLTVINVAVVLYLVYYVRLRVRDYRRLHS